MRKRISISMDENTQKIGKMQAKKLGLTLSAYIVYLINKTNNKGE